MQKLIIGLTGPMGSGKGEVVKILQEKGFFYVTLSDIVREEARKRGVPEERSQLMEVGNSLRANEGVGVLAKRSLIKILASDKDKWIVDGIRNPAEIEELRKTENVFIVGITAPREVLVERIMGRGRAGDAVLREEIIKKMDREWGKGEPEGGQQVGKCMGMVDFIIENIGGLEELKKKIEECLGRIF